MLNLHRTPHAYTALPRAGAHDHRLGIPVPAETIAAADFAPEPVVELWDSSASRLGCLRAGPDRVSSRAYRSGVYPARTGSCQLQRALPPGDGRPTLADRQRAAAAAMTGASSPSGQVVGAPFHALATTGRTSAGRPPARDARQSLEWTQRCRGTTARCVPRSSEEAVYRMSVRTATAFAEAATRYRRSPARSGGRPWWRRRSARR